MYAERVSGKRGYRRMADPRPVVERLSRKLPGGTEAVEQFLIEHKLWSGSQATDIAAGKVESSLAGRVEKLSAIVDAMDKESDDDIKARGIQAIQRLPVEITRDLIELLDEELAVYLATTKHRAAVDAALNGRVEETGRAVARKALAEYRERARQTKDKAG